MEYELLREKERLELEHHHETERYEVNLAGKNLELKSEKRNERYEEAKEALVNFMASSQESVVKQISVQFTGCGYLPFLFAALILSSTL